MNPTSEQIAIEVMGWSYSDDKEMWTDNLGDITRYTFGLHKFNPIHDHNDSAMVEEEMVKTGYDYGDINTENEKYVYFQNQYGGREIYLEYYKTIKDRPAAICKAALEAVKKEKNK